MKLSGDSILYTYQVRRKQRRCTYCLRIMLTQIKSATLVITVCMLTARTASAYVVLHYPSRPRQILQLIKMPAGPALICNRTFVAAFIKASGNRGLRGVLFLIASAQGKRFPRSPSQGSTGVKIQKRQRKCTMCFQL